MKHLTVTVFSLLDIDGNLILFFRIHFAGFVNEGCKHKIYKESNISDDFTQIEENNISNVFNNIGIGNYILHGAIAVKVFFEKGGRYKIDFTS